MAFWGIEVKPAKPFTLSLDKASGRLRISQATLGFGSSTIKSVVQCNVGKKSPVLLCSLLPGKTESCHLEVEFEEAEDVTFSVIGPLSVHLTGYFLSNARRLFDGDDDSESYGEDIGDTETERSDDCNDEDDDYGGSFIDDSDLEVFSPSPSPSNEATKRKTKKKKSDDRKSGQKRLKKKYELSESDDDVDVTFQRNSTRDRIKSRIVESEEEDDIPISSLRGSVKTVHEDSKRKMHDFANGTTDENLSEERKVKKKKRKSNKENEAIGDTERPLSLGKDEMKFTVETNTTKTSRTTSDGLVVEELEIGEQDGKVASSGKKVTIHYTGKLKKGGKVFDSTSGRDPLKFRLGKGRALGGLDLGIEGMRVGGKRRLVIPPALGYGSEGSERVPPNSWLIMEIELLKVR